MVKIVLKHRLFWYYTIVSKNGRVLTTSETYFKKANAKAAAERLGAAIKAPVYTEGER